MKLPVKLSELLESLPPLSRYKEITDKSYRTIVSVGLFLLIEFVTSCL